MINNNQKNICIVGLGSIGLPTACVLVEAGYTVWGIDTNLQRIKEVKLANLKETEPDLKNLLVKALQSGRLKIANKIIPANIYIIAVPTLLTTAHQPDLSYLDSAINSIRPCLRGNNLVLLESTCPVGTTEMIGKQLKEEWPDIAVAYCPERIVPGNIFYELVNNDRILGGLDNASIIKAKNFYESFIRGKVFTTDARTAELMKLAENAYRDINIAYANELSMITDSLNIDIHELIRLSNTHPRVNILKPGPGVGGRCIPVSPWFLMAAAPNLALLTATARQVNSNKVKWLIDKIRATIIKNKAQTIACLGLTYKADNADLRGSVAYEVVKTLQKEIKIFPVDPYVSHAQELYQAIREADIIVTLIAHQDFLNIKLASLKNKIVLDFAGIFK